jgi:hypothetical protein
MISVGTAEYSVLQQMERAVNTVFLRAELRISIFKKQQVIFKVKHSIMIITLLDCILKRAYHEDA